MSSIRSDSTLPAGRARFPSLREKRVFITGGASGIGACLVSAFAHEQAHVAFVDIDRDAAAALVSTLEANGASAPCRSPGTDSGRAPRHVARAIG